MNFVHLIHKIGLILQDFLYFCHIHARFYKIGTQHEKGQNASNKMYGSLDILLVFSHLVTSPNRLFLLVVQNHYHLVAKTE